MSVLTNVRLQRGFSEVLEREARAARARHDEAADELEAFIAAEAGQPETIRRLWDNVVDRARAKSLDDTQDLEAEFRALFDAALASLSCLREWALRVQAQTGQPVRGGDVLELTWRAVEELQSKIMADLAWFNEPPPEPSEADLAQVEAALAQVRRGEVEDIEDVIRELQGDDPHGSPADDR